MKTGDKVIVPAEINGYGRDLRAIVTEIEKFAGAIFVTVIFTEPGPEACGRRGVFTTVSYTHLDVYKRQVFTMTSS